MTRSAVAVGIDLGGTGTKLVAIDADGQVRGQATHATPRGCNPADALAFLTRHIAEVAGTHRIESIGIGASGPIGQDGRIHNPDTLPAFTDISLVDRLQGTYQAPVAIDTDAVAAALGEYRYGRTAPPRSMLVVTLGTGIGSCLLLDGTPFRGGDSTPPEGGHLTVPNAPPCYCGRPHCFEQALDDALTPLAPWVPTAPIRATQLGDLIGALGAAELAARKSTWR